MEHERFVRSDGSSSNSMENIARGIDSSTDTPPMSRNHNREPVSHHLVELNLLDSGDGFNTPGYGSTLDLVPNEEGGFENPGYLVMGTPEPVRSESVKQAHPNVKESQSVGSSHSKSIEEDFKDIQIQSLIDLGGETDVDQIRETVSTDQSTNMLASTTDASSTGIILGVPKTFSRGAPNRASFGALKARPGKLSEENIKRVTVDDNSDDDDDDNLENTVDKYYQLPPKNAMYPERNAKEEEEPTMFVHACYELTGSGVKFSDEDKDTLTSDSFI